MLFKTSRTKFWIKFAVARWRDVLVIKLDQIIHFTSHMPHLFAVRSAVKIKLINYISKATYARHTVCHKKLDLDFNVNQKT